MVRGGGGEGLEDGRTDPILDDVSEAFQLMGVSLHELEDYIHNIEPVTFPHQIPSFPVSKNNVLQFPQPGSKDAEERKEYIPDYMPPIVSSQEGSVSGSKFCGIGGEAGRVPAGQCRVLQRVSALVPASLRDVEVGAG
ncbi:hypothetical protein K5549_008299 [Capra hircus]|nr:hypothetical protein K5549_008299 [Capra hircus]